MEWFSGDVSNALSTYQEKKGILIVYVYAENDANSTKFDEVWDSFNFPSKVPYVAVRLVKDSEGANQFAQFFPTPVYPVCYIIGLNAQPLEVVTAMEEITADRLSNSMSKAITLFNDQLREEDIKQNTQKGGELNIESSLPGEEQKPDSGSTSPSRDASSEMTKEQKLEYYRKRLEEKRKEDAKKKEEEERAKEISRRNEGKSIAEAREKQREKELRELAEQRRKQKEEDAQALKKIREQVRLDKEERAKRNQGTDKLDKGESSSKPQEGSKIEIEQSINNPVNTEECRIQCRFPDGSTLNRVFPSKAPLQVVFDAVSQDDRKPSDFFLVQPYPRKKLTEYNQSLLELNLTPSSVLLVVSAGSQRSIVPSSGYLDMLLGIFYFPLHLFASTFHFFISMWRNSTGSNASQQNPTDERGKKREEGEEAENSQRDGNMHRLRNNDDNDHSDNEATWNGNSTQQL